MLNTVVIQIINYKTETYLKTCLESLYYNLDSLDFKFKVLILDNNSGDDLSKYENAYKNLSVFYNKENSGFGAGHNILFSKEKSKYILILNPDIVFSSKTIIKNLLTSIQETRADIIGPKLLMSNGVVQKYDHGELYGFYSRLALLGGVSHWRNTNNIKEVAWISGALMLMKRNLLNEIGVFDEKFFLYKEEEDFCLRARQKGFKIIYNPTIKVKHIGSVVASKSKYMQNSQEYFKLKHCKSKRISALFSSVYYKLTDKL